MIILQKDRILDLSRAEIVGIRLSEGQSDTYEMWAYFANDSIGKYVFSIPNDINKESLLRFLAEIKHNNQLILTPQELIERYRKLHTGEGG